jgi:hypothetical protein
MKMLIAIGQLRVVGRDEKGTALFLFGSRKFILHRTKRRGHKTTPAQVLTAAEEIKQDDIIDEAAEDRTAMLTQDEQACNDCGRAGFIDSIGRCHWCIAIEVQQRLDEKKAMYQPPAFASG